LDNKEIIPFPNKKYQIIYADPPWRYETRFDGNMGSRGKGKDYKTITLKNICGLPIQDITDNNCILFLWATYPCIKEALEVVKSWGFKYKTVAFTWVKRNRESGSWFWGMGYYTRANPEICILATKGKIKRISSSVHSILDNNIMEHSKKPSEARNRIVQLMGDLPRIELFARPPKDLLFEDESYKGWDLWGNEV